MSDTQDKTPAPENTAQHFNNVAADLPSPRQIPSAQIVNSADGIVTWGPQ